MEKRPILIIGVILMTTLMLVPVSFALSVSSVLISENEVIFEEIDMDVTVTGNGDTPFVNPVEHDGHPAFQIQESETSPNVAGSGNQSFYIDISAGVEFCFFVQKGTGNNPTVTIYLEGTSYVGHTLSGDAYYSIGNLQSNGTWMLAVRNLEQVNFMSFDEDVRFKVMTTRPLAVNPPLYMFVVYK